MVLNKQIVSGVSRAEPNISYQINSGVKLFPLLRLLLETDEMGCKIFPCENNVGGKYCVVEGCEWIIVNLSSDRPVNFIYPHKGMREGEGGVGEAMLNALAIIKLVWVMEERNEVLTQITSVGALYWIFRNINGP